MESNASKAKTAKTRLPNQSTNRRNKNKNKNKNKRNFSKKGSVAAKKIPKNIKEPTFRPDRRIIKEKDAQIRPLGYTDVVQADVSVHRILENINLQASSLYVALYTYLSRCLYLNKIQSSEQVSGGGLVYVQQGLAYLNQSIFSFSSGATYDATQVPLIFGVLMKMLTARSVKVGRSGEVNYSPQWDTDNLIPYSYTTPVGSKYTAQDPVAAPYVNMTYGAMLATKDGYTSTLRICDDSQFFGAKVVDLENVHGYFEKDPSAFARVYKYFGSGGTDATGLYAEAEIEVPFSYPHFSRFVQYDPQDKVISRVFHPVTGGLSSAIGLPLLYSPKDYTYSDLKNPIPIVYKYIDFYQFYTQVAFWLAAAFSTSLSNLEGSTFLTKPDTLPFSAHDFMLSLRQAVLINFPDQCHGQFIAPLQNQTGESIFQPFIVDTVGFPKSNANIMVLPEFFVENLSMLQPLRVKPSKTETPYGTVNKKVSFNVVPVWGVYSKDVPPDVTYTDSSGNIRPLFSSTSIIPACNIWDLTTLNNNNQKVNINIFVDQIMTDYNNIVTTYLANKSAKMAQCSVDKAKHSTVLHYTRVLNTYNTDVKFSANDLLYPADRFITNKPRKAMEKQDSKKKLKDNVTIDPATYYDLYTDFITSTMPISKDVLGQLRYFLLPSIRLNPSTSTQGSDIMTANAYQVYSGELDSVFSTDGNYSLTSAEVYRLFNVGSLCVTGMFAATDEPNTLLQAINIMNKSGSGADLVTSLLGGLVSMIPVVGPALGSLFT